MMEWVYDIVNSRSKSLFVVLLGFLFGIFIGALTEITVPSLWLIVPILFLTAAAILLWSNKPARVLLLVFLFFILGLFRFSETAYPAEANLVSDTLNRQIRIEGIIADEVIEKAEAQQIVIDDVLVGDTHALGQVMIWAPKYPRLEYGDRIAFRCDLEVAEPFEGFAYDKYLRSRGVLAVCWHPKSLSVQEQTGGGWRGTIFSMKRKVLDKTEQIFSEPQSTFLSGLLFGGKGSLSSEIRDDFVTTGTSHILAASGYNVSIFSRFIFLALVALVFRRKTALAIVAAMIGVYVVMSGLDPAVTRAGIMGLVVLFGRGLGRASSTASVRNVLALTAVVMLAANPYLLLDDVGFQLSFVSTIGLVLLVPRIEHWFQFIPTSGGFREAIVSTVAATGMSLPVLIWQFGSISIVSVLVNLIVLPLVPYTMALGAIAISAGFVSNAIASILAVPAWSLLSIMLYVVRWFAALPGALVQIPFQDIVAAAAALGLVGVIAFLFKQPKPDYETVQDRRRPVLASVSISALIIFSILFGSFDSAGTSLNTGEKMRVWFFDVGQGDSIFIKAPDGEQILVDGGPGEAVLTKLGAVMPAWDHTLDMVVLTHPHADHVSGLIEVLERYEVETIVMTGVNYSSNVYDEWWNQVELESAELILINKPQNIVIGSVSIQALWPQESYDNKNVSDINETSIVLQVDHGESSLLLTGDMYVEQEIELVQTIRDIDVLKVPHQGSLTSSSVEFIRAVDPEVGVITVGENSYGHPHPAVVARYQNNETELYRTDLDGDIIMTSDGEEYTVKASPLMF